MSESSTSDTALVIQSLRAENQRLRDMISGLQKCAAKTAKGNCYLTEGQALEAAHSMSLRRGGNIRSFRCLYGAHWHLGGVRTEGERLERAQ